MVGHGLRSRRRGHPVPVQLVVGGVQLREVVLRHEFGRRRRLRRDCRGRRGAVHLRLVGRRLVRLRRMVLQVGGGRPRRRGVR